LRIELREERAFAPSELVAEVAVTPQNPDGDDVKDASFVARVRRTLISVRKSSVFFSFPRRDARFPLNRTRGLPVVYTSGIIQRAGDAISFGFIDVSEVARSLP
jgi:hypothetical protein